MSRIAEIVLILNGYTQQGKRATFASDFRMIRYAIILLAGTTIDIFDEQTSKIQGLIYFNYYRLQKVAGRLQLEYDRTKIAQKIFHKLQTDGDVVIKKKKNRTYIALTGKGKVKCSKKLDQLCDLNRLFYSNPILREEYHEEGENNFTRRGKGTSSGMTAQKEAADILIRHISDW